MVNGSNIRHAAVNPIRLAPAPATGAVAQADRTEPPCWLYQMVENMPAAVILIDPETSRISYLNKSGEDLLGPIRHLLPGVPEWLEGCGMDIFHPDLTPDRINLADPANLPWGTRVQVKNEVFDLRIAAIRDRLGRYIGPIATLSPRAWAGADATGELPRAIAAIGEEQNASGRLADKISVELQRTIELIETLAQTTAEMGVAIDKIQDITTITNTLTLNASTLNHQSKAQSYLQAAS